MPRADMPAAAFTPRQRYFRRQTPPMLRRCRVYELRDTPPRRCRLQRYAALMMPDCAALGCAFDIAVAMPRVIAAAAIFII